jgi:hypothetical protein
MQIKTLLCRRKFCGKNTTRYDALNHDVYEGSKISTSYRGVSDANCMI